MRISYSALETYKTCPLKFKYQILDNLKTAKSIEAVFGNTVHSALKKMFERTPLFPTVDEVIDFFNDKWASSGQNFDKQSCQSYLEEGIMMIKNFYKKNPPWNFNVVELESRFEVSLNDPRTNERHQLAGIVDRIDKDQNSPTYEIIDYKTAKRMPSQETLDKDLQLSIYNLGLLKKWPHLNPENIKLSLYFLKHNEKIETKRTNTDLEKTKEQILKIINEIQELINREKEFIPTPSPLCDWCGYREICPMWKHLYEKPRAEIQDLLKEYFELDGQTSLNRGRLSQIKAQISDFMTQTGVHRVFGESGFITRISQEKEVFDAKKAKEILKKMGQLEEFITKKQFSTLRATKKKLQSLAVGRR